MSKSAIVVPRQSDWTGLKLRLDTQLYFYDVESPTSISLHEVYAIKDGPQIQRKIGQWDAETGLDIYVPFIWKRRSNMEVMR